MKVITLGINESFHSGKSLQEMLEWSVKKCYSLASQKPDMIVFPEVLFRMPPFDMSQWNPFFTVAIESFAQAAREIGCYIVYNWYEPHEFDSEKRYNTTVMLNKQGEVVAKYRKIHTVYEECEERKVVPGSEVCVVDTEYGRIGFATCFDIGWRDLWNELEKKGAQAVIWTSAYDGGNLLESYAVIHMYWVISSVRTYHARIIDPLGRTVAESARWDTCAIADIDLQTEVFHIDRQYKKIEDVRNALGGQVEIHTLSEANVFTISSKDPSWPMGRIKEEFGLMSYRDYHAEATAKQNEWREKYSLREKTIRKI